MDRGRDDAFVKDILSKLTKDETVLEEVRKMAGLSAQCPPRPRGDNNIDSKISDRDRSKDKNSVRTQRQKNKAEQRAAVESNDGELAFTIDKDSDTYRNIISTVEWYRDSFLIGSEFADQRNARRKAERENADKLQMMGVNAPYVHESSIPKCDPSAATCHPLLLSAGESYIRSIAAVDLLRPYATWAVSTDGPMSATATQSMAQSILLGQSSCDWAMRENLLWVLKDEEWREFAKNITSKYVDRSYRGC